MATVLWKECPDDANSLYLRLQPKTGRLLLKIQRMEAESALAWVPPYKPQPAPRWSIALPESWIVLFDPAQSKLDRVDHDAWNGGGPMVESCPGNLSNAHVGQFDWDRIRGMATRPVPNDIETRITPYGKHLVFGLQRGAGMFLVVLSADGAPRGRVAGRGAYFGLAVHEVFSLADGKRVHGPLMLPEHVPEIMGATDGCEYVVYVYPENRVLVIPTGIASSRIP